MPITLNTTKDDMLYYLHCAKRYVRKHSGPDGDSARRRRDLNRLIADLHDERRITYAETPERGHVPGVSR